MLKYPTTDAPRVVLLLHPFAGYDRGLLEGIARYAQLHGPWIFCFAGEYPEVPTVNSDSVNGEPYPIASARRSGRGASFSLRGLGASGVIGRIQTPAAARALLNSELPIIAVDLAEKQLAASNPLSRISEIRADSYTAGCHAAEHLIERGFTSFGFCGYQGRLWSDRREEGFGDRVRKKTQAYAVYEPHRRTRTLPWSLEKSLVASWLGSLPKPVGIMACNDIRGRQVIEACLQAGLSVPDDVGVVGVDEDRLLCDLANPPLSSVVFNLARAGYQAAELLDGLMTGRVQKPRQIVVDALWVIPRRSTDVMAVGDPHVAAALRHIRDHFRQGISVGDVVAVTGLSRRALEMRFQRMLQKTIRDEIQYARLSWSKKLLLDTNLSVEKVAHASGFSGMSYMSDVFRREVGISPSEYRRQSRPGG
jgi:LacI family transcriptional regulator